MPDTQKRDAYLAFAWHVGEVLLVLSMIGLIWSAIHLRPPKPPLVETRRR